MLLIYISTRVGRDSGFFEPRIYFHLGHAIPVYTLYYKSPAGFSGIPDDFVFPLSSGFSGLGLVLP